MPATNGRCPRCGGLLARDNPSGRCAPCQNAERDLLVSPPAVPADFWDHTPIRQALAERHLGRVIRAYRHHPYHGRLPLRQDTVARWLGIAQAQLSRAENGRPIVHLDKLIHWSQILGIPADLLWFKLPGDNLLPSVPVIHADQLDTSTEGVDTPGVPAVTVREDSEYGGDATNRRSFVITAALAGTDIADFLGSLLTSTDLPPRLGEEHVRSVMSVIDGFERTDAAIGGDELCDFAMGLHQRVRRWERECAYDRRVGDRLQVVLGELECWTGWFALDAERRPESRRYLTEAILRARLQDDPRLEVRALQCLSLLVRDAHPMESLQCAHAAMQLSAGWAPPRLTALLRLRTAHANAALGDGAGFSREMAKALSSFEHGERDDDPQYIHFLKPMELTGIEGHSHLLLGNTPQAARSFGTLINSADRDYRRNQILYSVYLAKAKVQERDLDAASQLAMEAIPAIRGIKSGRIRRLFTTLRADLRRESGRSALTRQFVAVHDEMVRV